MSLKELNDGWEKQFLGYTFTKRLEQRLIAEHRERILKEINHRIFETVIVSVVDKGRRIKGLGLSSPNDLILDNFGTWLAGLIRAPIAASESVSLKDSGGSTRTVLTYAANMHFNDSDSEVGTYLQVGSGTTPPARADYSITTAFLTAPESSFFDTGSGSYSVGAISFSGSITAGGSGTVNETGFFARWVISGLPAYQFMLFHDVLGTGVPFTAGEIITVSYSINL